MCFLEDDGCLVLDGNLFEDVQLVMVSPLMFICRSERLSVDKSVWPDKDTCCLGR